MYIAPPAHPTLSSCVFLPMKKKYPHCKMHLMLLEQVKGKSVLVETHTNDNAANHQSRMDSGQIVTITGFVLKEFEKLVIGKG
tara:strand:+ start:192 stop:440 length:249 start_codon:yes stop_codon:yes gene_type:complete